ncbi:MAG: M20 family metallo-hydrolase [Bacteroidaceae bacterium]|nr:M20 family metallo-hydrolase [Bacteroidaceae bacterium]
MTDIENLSAEATDLLKQLVATPRTSRHETDAADILARFMEEKGLFPHREANNIWCIAEGYDPNRPTLLLNAHIDTVKPVAAWTRDPFRPTLEGDRLYGLGTNDDGASLVCLLQTFRAMAMRPQSYNLVFLASAEEEVSGQDGLSRALPLLPHIDVALVGEPTGMQPAVAEKGLMVLDVTATGKAGHAAREEGVNAIYLALDDINWFRNYRFPLVSSLLGPVKMSVTVIQAGTQHNVVPDCCTFTVDVRSNECYSNEEIYQHICAAVKGQVKARSFRLNSSRIDVAHPLVQRAILLGPTADGKPRTPFGSPTLSDQALMPWPSMKMGPGDSARSHTADEYICIREIRAAIADYSQMLDGLQL